MDEDFHRSSLAALAEVSADHVPPPGFLATLAGLAADWPETAGEIWYGEIMQECFWALLRQAPMDHDEDGQGLALGVMLAMMSMDRGGHYAAADACEAALAHMASLPAWSEAGINVGPAEGEYGVAFKPDIPD